MSMRRRSRLLATALVGTALLVTALVAGAGLGLRRPSAPSAQAGAPTRLKEALSAADGPIDPAIFSPGACIAFGPTRGDRNETVFLDAGHGGIDPGGVGATENGTAVDESTVNLPIELDAMAILRAQGFRVVVSRTRNTSVTKLSPADVSGGELTTQGAFADVAARDVCANKARADILVGIYMDAGYAGEAGCVTGYDADRPFSADNLRLATLLQDDVLAAMNARGWAIPDEGVQTDTGLGSAVSAAAVAYGHLLLLGPAEAGYFGTPSQMPGALIEPLYLTDPFEASIAVNPQDQQVIAGAIAKAVDQYFAASVGGPVREGHRGDLGLAVLVRKHDADLVARVVVLDHRLEAGRGRHGVPGDRVDQITR
jgi:N-acetylmuramoyl-L-alanine amidase